MPNNHEHSLRFGVQSRIRTQAEYQQVFQANKKIFSQFFVLYYQGNDLNHGRLGIIISKRNLRLAVSRNRVRRLVREAFRLQQNKLTGLDIVIVAKKTANKALNSELQQCLEKLWARLEV